MLGTHKITKKRTRDNGMSNHNEFLLSHQLVILCSEIKFLYYFSVFEDIAMVEMNMNKMHTGVPT